jgi:hypothetical protein
LRRRSFWPVGLRIKWSEVAGFFDAGQLLMAAAGAYLMHDVRQELSIALKAEGLI